MSVVIHYKARVAADLAAAGTALSKWVPCRGARMVAFRIRATNANAPASDPVVHLSDDAVGYRATTSGTAALVGDTTAGAINAGTSGVHGITISMYPPSPGSVYATAYLVSGYARISIAGHATLIIAGLEIDAYVVHDDRPALIEETSVPGVPQAV